jgi:PAS domain S-box-containing protein
MGRTQNRPLPLILARELASNVATPFLVLDKDGTIVFFNERAEQIIGSTAAELGELTEEEWRALLKVERLDGTPVPSEQTPSAIARRECRPHLDTLVYTREDGHSMRLVVMAVPLLAHANDLAGVFLVFWET